METLICTKHNYAIYAQIKKEKKGWIVTVYSNEYGDTESNHYKYKKDAKKKAFEMLKRIYKKTKKNEYVCVNQ